MVVCLFLRLLGLRKAKTEEVLLHSFHPLDLEFEKPVKILVEYCCRVMKHFPLIQLVQMVILQLEIRIYKLDKYCDPRTQLAFQTQ